MSAFGWRVNSVKPAYKVCFFLNFDLKGLQPATPSLQVLACFISISDITQRVLSCDFRHHTFPFACLFHLFYEWVYFKTLERLGFICLFTHTWNVDDTFSDHSIWLNMINSSTVYTAGPGFSLYQVCLCGYYVIVVYRPIDLWTQSALCFTYRQIGWHQNNRLNAPSLSLDLVTITVNKITFPFVYFSHKFFPQLSFFLVHISVTSGFEIDMQMESLYRFNTPIDRYLRNINFLRNINIYSEIFYCCLLPIFIILTVINKANKYTVSRENSW